MIDFFDKPKLDLNNITCHSGGAVGSDFFFQDIGKLYNIKTKAYSYRTRYHTSTDKVEISDDDYKEGIIQIKRANHWLNRYGIDKYMNLLARNWSQVKYSKQIFAIGTIVDIGKKSPKGYYSKSKYQSVDGGTGYAVQMGIDNLRDIWVFEQNKQKWCRWSYSSMSFVETNIIPKIEVQDFAGIGTREILPIGIQAIKDLYKETFGY